MKADYFNNPLVPFKWYEVASTLERSLFKKLDVFHTWRGKLGPGHKPR